jgi:Tn7-like transposition protein D/TniQ
MRFVFGSRSNARSIDLPTGLELILNRLPIGHGFTLRELAEKHTSYPYVAQFAPTEVAKRIVRMMAQPRYRTPSRVGLMSAGFSTPAFLRFCTQCAKDDFDALGSGAWRRVHQLPGVFVCPTHGSQLMKSALERNGGSRGRRFTPLSEIVIAESHPDPVPDLPIEAILRLATGALTMLNRQPGCNAPALMTRLRELLSNYRWPQAPSLMQAALLAEDLVRHRTVSTLARTTGATWNVATVGLALNRLLYRDSFVKHPLLIQLVLEFAGANLEDALDLESPRMGHPDTKSCPSLPCANAVCHRYSGDPRIALSSLGLAAGRLHSRCGACEMVYSYDPGQPAKLAVLRPGHVWEEAMIASMSDSNVSVRKMAARLGVAPSTLQRHAIRLGVGRETWSKKRAPGREQRTEALRKVHRATWQYGRTTARATKSKDFPPQLRAAYRWLCRNDIVWLGQNFPLLRNQNK